MLRVPVWRLRGRHPRRRCRRRPDWSARSWRRVPRVALSDECNRHIAEKAVEKLQVLRAANGFRHQIAASAMSIDHADQVRAIFQEMGLQAGTIHSNLSDERKAATFAKLRNNQLDVIVQVAMLGEGLDHSPLSASMHRWRRTSV